MGYSVERNCKWVHNIPVDAAVAWKTWWINTNQDVAVLDSPICSVGHLDNPVIAGCRVSPVANYESVLLAADARIAVCWSNHATSVLLEHSAADSNCSGTWLLCDSCLDLRIHPANNNIEITGSIYDTILFLLCLGYSTFISNTVATRYVGIVLSRYNRTKRTNRS